jgi:hypothetical protein
MNDCPFAMDEPLHVVTYTGPFGFIKPWTAVRDELTYSQQFLTPSIVEGMRQKLGVSDILRHRLSHEGFSVQQEVTQTAGMKRKTVKKRGEVTYKRPRAILGRGVMLNPTLYLAFPTRVDAQQAHRQHLCLSRNEDVVMPDGEMRSMAPEEFDKIPGFELRFGKGKDAFMVGYNRFEDGAPMYGRLTITGNPVGSERIRR